MNVDQMDYRCPQSLLVGTGWINGYELLFKGSLTGFYATIEQNADSKVPCYIWNITEADEKSLDRYEGYPSYYVKEEWPVHMDDGSEIRGMIYIMKLIRNAPPQRAYYQGIADAYRALGLSRQVPALERSLARG